MTQVQKRKRYQAYVKRRQNAPSRVQPTKQTNMSRQQLRTTQYIPYDGPIEARPRRTVVPLSDCLIRYAKAAIMPTTYKGELPCIPDELPAPTYKFRTMVTATMKIGTNGIGFACLNPQLGQINNNAASGAGVDYPLVVSTATYPGTDSIGWDAAALGTGWVLGYNTNSFFDYQTFGESPFRVVAAGMTVKYSGQVVDQAGQVTMLQNDGLERFPTTVPITKITGNPRRNICIVKSDDICHVNYQPVSPENLAYVRRAEILPSGLTWGNNGYTLVIAVSGATPGTSFLVEAVIFYEAQIPGLDASPSHSDILGLAQLQAARSEIYNVGTPAQEYAAVLNKTIEKRKTMQQSSWTDALPFAGAAVGSAFGSPELGVLLGTSAKGLLNLALKD